MTETPFLPVAEPPLSYKLYNHALPSTQSERIQSRPVEGPRDKSSGDADEDSDKVVRKNQRSEVQSISGHPEDSNVLAFDDSAE